MILARSESRWLDLGRLAINVSFSRQDLEQSWRRVFLLAFSLCKPHDAVLQCISLSVR